MDIHIILIIVFMVLLYFSWGGIFLCSISFKEKLNTIDKIVVLCIWLIIAIIFLYQVAIGKVKIK